MYTLQLAFNTLSKKRKIYFQYNLNNIYLSSSYNKILRYRYTKYHTLTYRRPLLVSLRFLLGQELVLEGILFKSSIPTGWFGSERRRFY